MMIGTLGSVGSLVAGSLYRWNDDRNPWFINGMMTGTLDSVGSLVAATLYRWNDDRNPWFSRFISSSNPLSME
jgi:hypothetical protein